MNIIIDSREKEMFSMCSLLNTDILLTSKQLVLGDAIINDSLIIERKTLNDLAASIVDGRYKEQSFRLQKALEENYKVYYFIEGNIDLYIGNLPKTTLVRSIFSLTNKGFNVILTKNTKETAYFMIQFAEKIKTLTASPIKKYEETEGIIKTQKNKNITRDNISVFMLCQIPGISTVIATILMDNYKHITNLIKELDKNPLLLDEFEYINPKTNKPKKLNKNVIQNIKDYL
jgi:ERCC4-type nuclease